MDHNAGTPTNSKGKRFWAILCSVFAVIVTTVLVLAFFPGINAFGVYAAEPPDAALTGHDVVIAVFKSTRSLQRYSQINDNLYNELRYRGYMVDLLYAENDPVTQSAQIETEQSKKPRIMVIEPVDGAALGQVLAKVKQTGIKVIAYDRLITGTADVDYYAAFDNYKSGAIQAQYIEFKLGLGKSARPCNIELFAGSYDDERARQFYLGAMDVLMPHIQSGRLVVRSAETDFKAIAIRSWKSESAMMRMGGLLNSSYRDEKLDAVLSPGDSISTGVIAALEQDGYGKTEKPWPVITGQGCFIANVKAILAGRQSMPLK